MLFSSFSKLFKMSAVEAARIAELKNQEAKAQEAKVEMELKTKAEREAAIEASRNKAQDVYAEMKELRSQDTTGYAKVLRAARKSGNVVTFAYKTAVVNDKAQFVKSKLHRVRVVKIEGNTLFALRETEDPQTHKKTGMWVPTNYNITQMKNVVDQGVVAQVNPEALMWMVPGNKKVLKEAVTRKAKDVPPNATAVRQEAMAKVGYKFVGDLLK